MSRREKLNLISIFRESFVIAAWRNKKFSDEHRLRCSGRWKDLNYKQNVEVDIEVCYVDDIARKFVEYHEGFA